MNRSASGAPMSAEPHIPRHSWVLAIVFVAALWAGVAVVRAFSTTPPPNPSEHVKASTVPNNQPQAGPSQPVAKSAVPPSAPPSATSPSRDPSRPASPAPVAAAPSPATNVRLLAGRVMMVGIPERWSKEDPSPLDKVPAGSVILYRRNIKVQQGAAGVRRLCDDIRDYVVATHTGAPAPIIAIDHEGGRVNRLKGIPGVTPYPFNGQYVGGKLLDKALALVASEGSAMGAELSALGIDLNLAPVVDVVTNGQNSDIAERAYSSQTQRAAELGPAFIQAIRQAGLRSCAKHWPGYGPIGRNPHEDLVHANTSEAEWGRTHMPPFWAAIRAGTDCVMVGHVIYDFLPSGKPASIDPQVYAMLRRAPFDGAVLTDDLEMGGVSRLYGDNFAKVAVDAVRAGADMVLICHTPSRAVAAHRALVKAATAGKLDLQEHAARIDALRLAR